ncbi:MAG: cell division protein FtsZ, partial [Paracoccaceae bacterium]
TQIIITNQNLFRLANEKTTFTEAFSMADDVLYQGVKGVTDLMVRPGLINLDFADVRAVMDEMGKAMMGTGEAEGEDRAIQAAEAAIANPLLDEISLRGAKGVLINITGAHDLTLFELDEAANRIREEVDPDANIIVGSTLDTAMEGMMRVSVVATGIDASEIVMDVPVPRRSLKEPLPAGVAAPIAAAEALPETQPALVASATEEPSLFEAVPQQQTEVAQHAPEQAYEQQEYVAPHADDLPPPAYQPQVPAFAPREDSIEADPETFVAPQAPAPGTPSAETMERLRAATQMHREAAAPAPVQDIAHAHDAERPRFGINSLINRMTGHSETPARQPMPPRAQPPVHGQAAHTPAAPQTNETADVDQDRIEIPAFLRRQAN